MNTKTRRNHTRIDAISTEKATHFKDVRKWMVGIKTYALTPVPSSLLASSLVNKTFASLD